MEIVFQNFIKLKCVQKRYNNAYIIMVVKRDKKIQFHKNGNIGSCERYSAL